MTRFAWLLLLLLLHILVFAYPVLRIGGWLGLETWLLMLIVLPLFSSQYVARRVLYTKGRRATHWQAALRNAIDYLLGVFSVAALVLLVLELVFQLWPAAPVTRATLALSGTAILLVWGTISAWRPHTRELSLASHKLKATYRIVQLSDVHIGSRSRWFLRYLRWRVNRMQPDLVCITGDLIDQPGLDEYVLADLGRFKAPVYYVTGNHERYEDLTDILQRLRNLGVHVLDNRRDDWHELSIVGIDDDDAVDQVERVLAGIELSESRFNLLLYHKPLGLRAAAEQGVDLMLSGHTHGGQIWPFHLAVRKVFRQHRGRYDYRGAVLYVSEGTGTWGPTLRFFSRSEITEITLGPRVIGAAVGEQ